MLIHAQIRVLPVMLLAAHLEHTLFSRRQVAHRAFALQRELFRREARKDHRVLLAIGVEQHDIAADAYGGDVRFQNRLDGRESEFLVQAEEIVAERCRIDPENNVLNASCVRRDHDVGRIARVIFGLRFRDSLRGLGDLTTGIGHRAHNASGGADGRLLVAVVRGQRWEVPISGRASA